MKALQFRSIWLLVFSLLTLSSVANAAQDAMVTVERASIYEKPTKDSAILEIKKSGDKIRISSYSKEGWYKTRASTGKYGWIWQANITIDTLNQDIQTADLELKQRPKEERREMKEPWLFVRGGGFLFGLISTEVSHRMGLGSGRIYPALGFFGEVAFRVEEKLRLAFRIGNYSASKSTTAVDGTSYNIEHSGTPALIGLDTDIVRGELIDFTAGLYAGLGLSNTLTVKATNQATPNSFTLSSTSYAVLLNFTGKYWLSKRLALIGEFGLYYSNIPRTKLSDPGFNGDGPFRDAPNDTLTSLLVNHVGPTLGVALQAAF